MTLQDASILAKAGFMTISISLLLLLFAFISAKRREFRLHKWLMLSAIITNLLFLFLYIGRLIIEGNTGFRGSSFIRNFVYFPILITHITTAILSIYFVSKQVLLALKHVESTSKGIPVFKGDNRIQHRKNGKVAIIIWAFSFIGGITVFLLLYII